jgi:hypothetical protein
MYAGSKFPTFSLGYKSAFSSLLGTDSKYSLLKIGIRQKIDYGFENHFSYLVSAGAFLNKSHLYFEDFQHFNTLPTPVRFNSTENAFRLLPAYLYSTGTRYAEAHTDLNSNRILLKRLPFIKNLPISESIFVNYLTTPEIKNYVETGYGFSNLLMLFSAEVIAGFENGTFKSAGVKLIMNLK